MDQIKVGRFIAEKRKEKKLTQMQLAEILGITDRAVSKWENGKSLPDSSIMLSLCEELEITVNDLLSGEVVTMTKYDETVEKNLIDAVKAKEQADKNLLRMEVLIILFSIIIMLAADLIAAYVLMPDWMRIVIVVAGLIPCVVGLFFAMKIEQVAGYYECKHCHHRYVPTFKAAMNAPHMGRTKYMRCPECGKKSWQKKRVSKEG
ncbi:MAG: helix-turn-helix transcriptional regulator [Ruminococcus sp.]|nr:helix-turn-helix transcriptional regulator [Ruminococcus sp.]